ncbi:hypothetical protein SK128_007565 [Halocaridina rubra]|uniref:C3H1-type domain-containing protein n=1 Tax=Halocaridina rubra TaxID=373956 RepID=A0AAN8XN13_HALRR
MRDDRNLVSVGKAHSPSTKRRRGRRNHKSNGLHVNIQTYNNVPAEKARKSHKEMKPRKRRTSSTEEKEKHLLTNLFKFENSEIGSANINPLTKQTIPEVYPHWISRERTECLKISRDIQNGTNFSHCLQVNQTATSCTLSDDMAVAQRLQPLMKKSSEEKRDEDKENEVLNLEEVKVADVLKSVLAKEYKAIPARPSNPLRYKTELCRAHDENGFCRFGQFCTFAHGTDELRAIARHHKYKTELCRSYHTVGYCQYGTRCHFVHDQDDGASKAASGKALASQLNSTGLLPTNKPAPAADIQSNYCEMYKNLLPSAIQNVGEESDSPLSFSKEGLDLLKREDTSFMDFLLNSRDSTTSGCEYSFTKAKYDFLSTDKVFGSKATQNVTDHSQVYSLSPTVWSPCPSPSTTNESWWIDIDYLKMRSSSSIANSVMGSFSPTKETHVSPGVSSLF